MGFVANFMRFPAVQKLFENGLRFDKVTDSFRVGTFLRHSETNMADAYYNIVV